MLEVGRAVPSEDRGNYLGKRPEGVSRSTARDVCTAIDALSYTPELMSFRSFTLLNSKKKVKS